MKCLLISGNLTYGKWYPYTASTHQQSPIEWYYNADISFQIHRRDETPSRNMCVICLMCVWNWRLHFRLAGDDNDTLTLTSWRLDIFIPNSLFTVLVGYRLNENDTDINYIVISECVSRVKVCMFVSTNQLLQQVSCFSVILKETWKKLNTTHILPAL